MSEYQFVMFKAVDQPLNDKQLQFAERQSSRAEVSRWSLSVEYDYSSFGGNVDGLLRGGYDVYLQYTDYGTREIKLRLPSGLPWDKKVWSKYVDGEQLRFKADTKGRGGILTLNPFDESGDFEVEAEFETYLDAVVEVRKYLMGGDLRALYLLWLCAANDDNNDPAKMIEPPVPHGIAESATWGGEILLYFGLDPLLLVAAGSGVPTAPNKDSKDGPVVRWVQSLDHQRAKEVIQRLLVGDTASEKARLLGEIRDSQTSADWPTSDQRRSLEELLQQTKVLRAEENAKRARKAQAKAKRAETKAQRDRADRMKLMHRDPAPWLRQAEQLADARGTDNYRAAADILHDLREAIGGDEGGKITRRHAAHLVKKHPTLTQLKGSLRKRGLID